VELRALYPEYKKFCEAAGEPLLSEKSFSQKLEAQAGLIKRNDSRSRRACFRGIRLRTDSDAPWGDAGLGVMPERAIRLPAADWQGAK
jgi:hypothetical protein